MARLTIIAATEFGYGIGIENRLPWDIPEDLKRFKEITMGHTVIMGRKTYESIGKPLPGRRNIVITTSRKSIEGVEMARSVWEAVAMTLHDKEAFIIGGATLYAQTMDLADRMLITMVHSGFECDAFFPAHWGRRWAFIESTILHSSKQNLTYSNVTYEAKF